MNQSKSKLLSSLLFVFLLFNKFVEKVKTKMNLKENENYIKNNA